MMTRIDERRQTNCDPSDSQKTTCVGNNRILEMSRQRRLSINGIYEEQPDSGRLYTVFVVHKQQGNGCHHYNTVKFVLMDKVCPLYVMQDRCEWSFLLMLARQHNDDVANRQVKRFIRFAVGTSVRRSSGPAK
jgi:hypothetical protein